jgi:integrase
MSGVYKYETKAGPRWRIVYDGPPVLDPETGEVRRRQTQRRGFLREKEAKQALRAVQGDVDDGTYVEPDQITLGTYLTDEWLPSIKPRSADSARRHRGTVSAATHDRYRRDLTRYVIPRLGSTRLQALTSAQLDALYDHLETSGGEGGRPLKSKTVANIHATLHKALADAVKRGRRKRNPADAVSPPTATSAPSRWWSVEELRTFLRHVEDDELYAAWLLFATTGARSGEVAGLAWEDLDLDGGWLRIDWTLGVVDGKLTWKPRPKSKAGERTMALDPATVAALREHRKRQLEYRVLAGPAWQDSFTDWQGLTRTGLLWTYGDGALIRPVTFYRRFVGWAAEAGLPRIRLHDVRHSYASAALASASGWHDVKVISQRLGHANVAITLASSTGGRNTSLIGG